jgi:hypothetical protein
MLDIEVFSGSGESEATAQAWGAFLGKVYA